MSSFKSYMPWPEQTSYEMNYNIYKLWFEEKKDLKMYSEWQYWIKNDGEI